jgi:hypothetical protein
MVEHVAAQQDSWRRRWSTPQWENNTNERNIDMTHPEFHSAEPLDRSEWIPLSDLAAEGFGRPPFGGDSPEDRIANLRRELAEHILLDDIGRAHVPRRVARELFAERAQKQAEAAAREKTRAAEMAAKPNPMDQVLKAIDARHERLRATGMLDDPTLTAFAVMAAGDHQARMEAKGRHLDEMMRSGRDGSLTMHRFDKEEG